MRPAIILAIAEARGLSREEYLPIMKAAEYLHTASLIFDDLPSQDNASERRGKPALHKVYGVATSELAGISLLTQAFQELSKVPIDEVRRLEMVELVARYSGSTGLTLGQERDLRSRRSAELRSPTEMIHTYYLKTGIALELSADLAALAGALEKEDRSLLRTYARELGIAYQIFDDILDVSGNAESMGKRNGVDAANGHLNLCAIMGEEAALKVAQKHVAAARSALKELSFSVPIFEKLLNYVVSREK